MVSQSSLFFFLALALLAAVIVIIGLVVDRKGLIRKAVEAEATALATKITGGTKMAYSPFAPTTLVRVGPAPSLPVPVLVSYVQDLNEPEKMNTTWQLPPLDKNGQPIQAMSELHVYATKKGIIGEVTALFGLEPNDKVGINPSQAGQNINVKVGPLEFDTDYEFTARIKE